MENKIQYTITINQLAIMRLGAEIDIIDAAIVDFIRQFMVSGKMKSKEIDGKPYFWLKASYITDQLPILGISEDWAKRRIVKLVKSGYMDMKLVDGNAPHVSLTEKGNSLFFGGVGENSEGGSEKTPTNYSTSNNNTETQKKHASPPKSKRKIEYYESPEQIPNLDTFPECYRETVSTFYKLGAKIRKSADTEEIKTRLKSSFLKSGLADSTSQGTVAPHTMLIKVELYRFLEWHESHNKVADGLRAWETWTNNMAKFREKR